MLQRLALCDRVRVEPAARLSVRGFAEDSLVGDALSRLAAEAGVEPGWAATIDKKLPVAAGLGGGSSDAATALRLANDLLPEPLPPERLHALAAALGADVPFFLASGPQLGTGDGSELSPLDLPQDYWVLLLLPEGAEKPSTGAVYEAFDARGGEEGFAGRREALVSALPEARRARDLAGLPRNDLAASPLALELEELGAFRADVTGAGPVIYGLFLNRSTAGAARRALRGRGRIWLTVPAWYG